LRRRGLKQVFSPRLVRKVDPPPCNEISSSEFSRAPFHARGYRQQVRAPTRQSGPDVTPNDYIDRTPPVTKRCYRLALRSNVGVGRRS